MRKKENKKGFTLVEVMVALAIMAGSMTAIFYVVDNVLQVYNNNSGKIQSIANSEILFEFMTEDLESVVIRSTNNDEKAWLQINYNQVPDGPMALLDSDPSIMFFSSTPKRPKTDSSGEDILGNITLVKYQMAFKSPFLTSTGSSTSNMKQIGASFGMYRATIDSENTFKNALDEDKAVDLYEYWNTSSTVLNDVGVNSTEQLSLWSMSRTAFLVPNIIGLKVKLFFKYEDSDMSAALYSSDYSDGYVFGYVDETGLYLPTGKDATGDITYESSGSNITEVSFGNTFKVGGVDFSDENLANAQISHIEISAAFLSAEGLKLLNPKILSGSFNNRSFKKAAAPYTTVVTRTINFMSAGL